MARERVETVIDGHCYEMTMLPATQGYRLFHRLFKMFGPSIGSLIESVGDGDIQDVDLGSKTFVEAIQALTEHVKESDLDHVIDQLKGATHVGIEGGATVPLKGLFELHFQGDIGGMFKWLAWGLKVQYATFIDAFESLKQPGKVGAGQAATSQTQ